MTSPTKDPAAVSLGRKGGQTITPAKSEASRRNGAATTISIKPVAALYQRFRDIDPEAAENALAELFNEQQRAQIAPTKESQ